MRGGIVTRRDLRRSVRRRNLRCASSGGDSCFRRGIRLTRTGRRQGAAKVLRWTEHGARASVPRLFARAEPRKPATSLPAPASPRRMGRLAPGDLAEGHGVTDARPSATGGILYLVATPIGNLEDITSRAVRVLSEVDVVAAEDTRRTHRLLERLGISVRMVSLFEHNERARVPGLIRRLKEGARVAVVTDAGSPGVSDPGFPLVRAAVAEGVRVESIPGPSAVISALQVSGLPTDAFTFAGFLPVRPGPRRRRLEDL